MSQEQIDQLLRVLTAIFSWIALAFISSILSGLLLGWSIAKNQPLEPDDTNLLKINFVILRFSARKRDAVLGFSFFLVCLLCNGLIFGQNTKSFVTLHFGLPIGQFDGLIFLSSL